MRALIVSDVHSNLEAFLSVIADAEGRGDVDEIWSLGDLIGYGPDPAAVIDILRSRPHQAVAGNHDLAAVGKLELDAFNPHAAAANRWTAEQLSPADVSFIEAQELKLELGEFTLVHGSPRDPIWEYVIDVQSAVATFTHYDTYWCLLGHSHVPFLCRPNDDTGATYVDFPLDIDILLRTNRLIINPGSVGQPRDGDPRASYAIYNSHSGAITHHRVEYDIEATQQKMIGYELPEMLISRLPLGR